MKRREEANYKLARFPDPQAHEHFETIVETGLRRAIAAYIHDDAYLYTFDPDHAMLALPVEALKLAMADRNLAINADTDMQRFLRSVYSDRDGALADCLRLLKL
jgi:hypothetical protein